MYKIYDNLIYLHVITVQLTMKHTTFHITHCVLTSPGIFNLRFVVISKTKSSRWYQNHQCSSDQKRWSVCVIYLENVYLFSSDCLLKEIVFLKVTTLYVLSLTSIFKNDRWNDWNVVHLFSDSYVTITFWWLTSNVMYMGVMRVPT